MLKSDKLEFEHGAAAKTENEDRYNGKENRHHDRPDTAGSRKSLASLGPVEILSKDTQTVRCAPQSSIELMTQKEILNLEPAPRLQQVDDKSAKKIEDGEHRVG